MAKIHEEIIVIKLSKLIKDSDQGQPIASAETVSALQQVSEELFGNGVIVEVENAS